MYEITHNGLLLAMGGSIHDIPRGSQFFHNPQDMLQWAIMYYDAGHKFQPHIHKVRERKAKTKTLEFVIVLVGKMRADYYSLDKVKIDSRVMREGDFVCLYDGGHGFEILKDGTKLIEIKLGEFTKVEDDKEKF
jgi:hypothetical protein